VGSSKEGRLVPEAFGFALQAAFFPLGDSSALDKERA